MHISKVIPQLRTTDLAASIEFYTAKLGFTLDFQYDDFYAAVSSGVNVVHLKLIDAPDPSVAFVDRNEHFHLYLQVDDVSALAADLERRGVQLTREVHDTEWGTRECSINDNAGHTLYIGQRR